MRIIDIEISNRLRKKIILDGLCASVYGEEGIIEWASIYSPQDDIWCKNEKEYVEQVKNYLCKNTDKISYLNKAFPDLNYFLKSID